MNISLSELLVVLLIALLVIKPEQLPDAAYSLGRFAKWARGIATKIKAEMNGMIDSVEQAGEQKREQK